MTYVIAAYALTLSVLSLYAGRIVLAERRLREPVAEDPAP